MSTLLHDRIRWQLDDGVARITLARPDAGNALDIATAEALGEAADRVEQGGADGSVRVAVLAAEGRAFCVGGDLREFAAIENRGEHVATVADTVHRAIAVLRGCAVPVVGVVQGTIAGGGVGVALAADVVLIAEEATIRLGYTAAGLSPDCGSTWVLTHRIGPARTSDLALTNRPITGREAADWGLVSRAVPGEQLAAVADDVVAGLRSGPAAAFAETKGLIGSARTRSLSEQMDVESATVARMAAGPDGREGIDAFLAKRAPSFG